MTAKLRICFHGTAKLRNDLAIGHGRVIPAGAVGDVTAYLPDDKLFAMYFGPEQ